jgi:N-acetyl-anhydromuramyl-L-alanine amidase AmpD
MGYHFFINFSGYIERGRPIHKIGAHCYGYNKTSIGICLAGLKLSDFTQKQFNAAQLLLTHLTQIYPAATIHPHNKFNPNKTCPVFPIQNITPLPLPHHTT